MDSSGRWSKMKTAMVNRTFVYYPVTKVSCHSCSKWTRVDSGQLAVVGASGLVWTRLDSRQLAVVGASGLEWTRLDSPFIAVVWAIWTNPV